MPELAEHPFELARDVPPLVAAVANARAADHPHAFLHPGGLQWLLRRLGDPSFTVRQWRDGLAFTGAVVDDDGYVMVVATDPSLDRYLWLLERAEDAARARGRAAIDVSVRETDAELLRALVALGYAPSGQFGAELVWRIDGEPPRAVLPGGHRFVTFTPSMDDAYIELHRAAWSTIRPSAYRRALHDIVTSMPQFDRAMVPLVAAPDGTLAAYCIGWFDPVSRWTEIEPLGTHPAHRGAGLAHAVVREVIHRSWQRGAEAVMVWATDPTSTSHVNEPARRLYLTSGMQPEVVLRDYRRALSSFSRGAVSRQP